MFLFTAEHRLILGVLEKTGCLRQSHVERLLSAAGAQRDGGCPERLAAQLRHMQKVRIAPDGVIVPAHLADTPPDPGMLSAVDVMIDISGGRLLAVKSGAPPFKLRFLVDTRDGMGSYAVIAAAPGREPEVNFLLDGMRDEKRVIIVLLENADRAEMLKIRTTHFFAVREGGKIRYFEGASGAAE